MDDQNLLELARQSKTGNSLALEDLVKACQPGAFRLALSILDDPNDADDVAQEALIHAVKAISSFRGASSFRTWLYRIIVNACLGKLRKRRARQRLSHLLAELYHYRTKSDVLPERQAIQDESSGEVLQAVNLLDDNHRLPVLLRYYQELPIAEIAQILNISTRTVHIRLNQAHEAMRKVLGEDHGDN